MNDSGYTIDDIKRKKKKSKHVQVQVSEEKREESDELAEDYNTETEDYKAEETGDSNFEGFKGIQEIEAELGHGLGKNDDDIDPDDYPWRKTADYHPPLPKKRSLFHKRNKFRHKMEWDYDKDGTEYMQFPSDWTAEDEKIFQEKALPEYKANLKNRKEHLAKVYSVPNTWRKKVYDNIKEEEFGQPRSDPTTANPMEEQKEQALLDKKHVDKIIDIYVQKR